MPLVFQSFIKKNKRMESNTEIISNFVFQGLIKHLCISRLLRVEKNLSNMKIKKDNVSMKQRF